MGASNIKWDDISRLNIDKIDLIKNYKGNYLSESVLSKDNINNAEEFLYIIKQKFNNQKWNNLERNRKEYIFTNSKTRSIDNQLPAFKWVFESLTSKSRLEFWKSEKLENFQEGFVALELEHLFLIIGLSSEGTYTITNDLFLENSDLKLKFDFELLPSEMFKFLETNLTNILKCNNMRLKNAYN